MAKKQKLFMAFEGTPAELRDCLIEHFKHEGAGISNSNGSTWNDGVNAGKRLAYVDIVHFLKKLTVNDSEHQEQEEAEAQP